MRHSINFNKALNSVIQFIQSLFNSALNLFKQNSTFRHSSTVSSGVKRLFAPPKNLPSHFSRYFRRLGGGKRRRTSPNFAPAVPETGCFSGVSDSENLQSGQGEGVVVRLLRRCTGPSAPGLTTTVRAVLLKPRRTFPRGRRSSATGSFPSSRRLFAAFPPALGCAPLPPGAAGRLADRR